MPVRLFKSRNQCHSYTVVVVKDGLVVTLLFKELSRILDELHALSKGINLELILSFNNICLTNFHGFNDPQNSFNNEKFLDYGIRKTT